MSNLSEFSLHNLREYASGKSGNNKIDNTVPQVHPVNPPPYASGATSSSAPAPTRRAPNSRRTHMSNCQFKVFTEQGRGSDGQSIYAVHTIESDEARVNYVRMEKDLAHSLGMLPSNTLNTLMNTLEQMNDIEAAETDTAKRQYYWAVVGLVIKSDGFTVGLKKNHLDL